MKWPKLQRREIRLAIITCATVFILLNYLLVIPWWRRGNESARDLDKTRKEIVYRNEVLGHVDEWRQELSRLVQTKESTSPHIGSQETWMKHFESLAGKSGIQLIQRRSELSKIKSKPNQLNVNCSLQGNFESVVKFLHSVSTDASHPQIEGCQLSPLKLGEDKLKGQITLMVLLKPPQRK